MIRLYMGNTCMDFGQNILAQQIECIASVYYVYFHGGKETYNIIYIVVVESSAGRRC